MWITAFGNLAGFTFLIYNLLWYLYSCSCLVCHVMRKWSTKLEPIDFNETLRARDNEYFISRARAFYREYFMIVRFIIRSHFIRDYCCNCFTEVLFIFSTQKTSDFCIFHFLLTYIDEHPEHVVCIRYCVNQKKSRARYLLSVLWMNNASR